MSTTLTAADVRRSADSRRRVALPSWLREPLVHFLLIGVMLFGLDHFIDGRADDPRVIVVDAKVDAEARKVFKESRGREPNKDELYALRKVWLDNEVLYREGLALQLDKGDNAIRERVIFKALSMIDAGTRLPPIDDARLREWFESHREKYDEPARYEFQEAVLSGKPTDASVQAFVHALNSGTPGDAEAGLRVFKGRPRDNLVQSYGAEFATAIDAVPTGEWRALPSKEGLRAIRLESISQAAPAEFESLRNIVLQDWTDATLAEQRSAAVRALAKKYVVKVEATEP